MIVIKHLREKSTLVNWLASEQLKSQSLQCSIELSKLFVKSRQNERRWTRVPDILTGYFVSVITLTALPTFAFWFGLGQGEVLPENWRDIDIGEWAYWAL
jgi:hypothetical protein